MKKYITGVLLVMLMAGCHFSKSVKKDFVSGLTTKGDVLSCDNVYMTINNEKSERNNFDYGESVNIIYDDVEGFTEVDKKVFPKMDIIVINDSGDTVLKAFDLYSEYNEGMDFSPLQLIADLTVADPIKSGGKYVLNVIISDRKGTGSFSSTMNFSVNKNNNLQIETSGVTFNEVYLYSQDEGKVINDNKVRFEENVYVIIEGIKGFALTEGLVYPGLRLMAKDTDGNLILNYTDMFSEFDKTGVLKEDFADRVSTNFRISGINFNNPMHLEMVVWDKKSEANLRLTTDIEVVKE